ncbi:MAG: DUF177 domain-containing protein [Alphaproteobacteria bacterium]
MAEFSHPVAVHRLGAENTFDIAATTDECRALAARFGVKSFSDITARVTLTKLESDRRIRLDARFSYDVVQSCVVTLKPLASQLDGRFSLIFETDADQEREVMVSLDGDDPPEPLVDGIIDIGEAVAEHLGLALEAFPRAPNADDGALAAVSVGAASQTGGKSPFSVLGSLKSKQWSLW